MPTEIFGDISHLTIEQDSTIEQIIYRSSEVQTFANVSGDQVHSNLKELGHLNCWTHFNGFSKSNCKILLELGISELYLEDILSTMSLPYMENHDYLIAVLKENVFSGSLESRNIGIILKGNHLITFSSKESDFYQRFLEKRFFHKKSKISREKAPFLFMALLDHFIEQYIKSFKKIKIDYYKLSEKLTKGENTHDTITAIIPHREKIQKGSFLLEKIDDELKDAIGEFKELDNLRYESLWDEIHENIRILNLKSHSLLDNFSNAINLSIAITSSKQNDTMMVLAVLSTFFLPLTFITGLYGMNFDPGSAFNMPELKWRFGYFFALSLMFISILIVFIFFRRKKWI